MTFDLLGKSVRSYPLNSRWNVESDRRSIKYTGIAMRKQLLVTQRIKFSLLIAEVIHHVDIKCL